MEIFLGTAGQAREYIKNLFGAVIELREQGMERRYDNLIQHAKAYIEDNYNHEDISLNMVASEVNLSSSHFSTVFGQETGVTFVEYLTKVRMDKAKQLLRTTGTKTTEIAFEVGFRDAHYFSNLFKRHRGVRRGNTETGVTDQSRNRKNYERKKKIFIKKQVVSAASYLCDPTNGYDHIFAFMINNVSSKYDHIVEKITKANAYNIGFKEDIDYVMYIIVVNSERAEELVDTQKPQR